MPPIIQADIFGKTSTGETFIALWFRIFALLVFHSDPSLPAKGRGKGTSDG